MAASIMLHLKLSEIYNSIVHSLNIVSECTLTYSRLQHTGNDDIKQQIYVLDFQVFVQAES